MWDTLFTSQGWWIRTYSGDVLVVWQSCGPPVPLDISLGIAQGILEVLLRNGWVYPQKKATHASRCKVPSIGRGVLPSFAHHRVHRNVVLMSHGQNNTESQLRSHERKYRARQWLMGQSGRHVLEKRRSGNRLLQRQSQRMALG